MSACTIDLETTVRNKGDNAVGKMLASPFCRENEIVAHGVNLMGTTTTFYKQDAPYKEILNNTDTLVAQNMQFDLKWLLRDYNSEFMDWLVDGKLWCTMMAEYVLSGMTQKFPSLNYLSKKYGGTQKNDAIKEYWDAGYDTSEIPEQELIEYLVYDVDNTKLVYDGQLALAKKLGMEKVLDLHMEMLLGVVLMEFNGCKFDLAYSRNESKNLDVMYTRCHTQLLNRMKDFFIEDVWEKLNPESGDQLSIVLFGGEYKHDEAEPMLDKDGEQIYFKSGIKEGLLRTKKVLKTRQISGFGVKPKEEWALKKEGFYSVDEDTIKTLLIDAEGSLKSFLDNVLLLRTLSKDNGTYHKGYAALVHTDGFIHHNLNTSKTNTSRLSSSSPNMQNLSGG